MNTVQTVFVDTIKVHEDQIILIGFSHWFFFHATNQILFFVFIYLFRHFDLMFLFWENTGKIFLLGGLSFTSQKSNKHIPPKSTVGCTTGIYWPTKAIDETCLCSGSKAFCAIQQEICLSLLCQDFKHTLEGCFAIINPCISQLCV